MKSLAQQEGDQNERDNQTEEDQTEAEPALPDCTGAKGE